MNETVIFLPDRVTLPTDGSASSVELFRLNGEPVELFQNADGHWTVGCRTLGYQQVQLPESREELIQLILGMLTKLVIYRGPLLS